MLYHRSITAIHHSLQTPHQNTHPLYLATDKRYTSSPPATSQRCAPPHIAFRRPRPSAGGTGKGDEDERQRGCAARRTRR